MTNRDEAMVVALLDKMLDLTVVDSAVDHHAEQRIERILTSGQVRLYRDIRSETHAEHRKYKRLIERCRSQIVVLMLGLSGEQDYSVTGMTYRARIDRSVEWTARLLDQYLASHMSILEIHPVLATFRVSEKVVRIEQYTRRFNHDSGT